jgi:HSP20 family protein
MSSLIPWRKRPKDAGGDLIVGPWERELSRFRDEFHSLLDRFWSGWRDLGDEWFGDPRAGEFELAESDTEYVLRAEAPGFDAADFDIRVAGNQIVVSAEKKERKESKGGASFRSSSLRRSTLLPHGVKVDEIDARYRNGILEIRLPKSEESKGKRIAVKAV